MRIAGLQTVGVANSDTLAVGRVGASLHYETYVIFFKNRGGIVQNFLYFCTLELIPMAGLWGLLTMACNYLKVNY